MTKLKCTYVDILVKLKHPISFYVMVLLYLQIHSCQHIYRDVLMYVIQLDWFNFCGLANHFEKIITTYLL